MCIPKLIRNEMTIFIKLVQILKEKHQNNNNNNKILKKEMYLYSKLIESSIFALCFLCLIKNV